MKNALTMDTAVQLPTTDQDLQDTIGYAAAEVMALAASCEEGVVVTLV